MRRGLWLLLLALASPVSAQSVPVTFAWDLDPTHDGVIGWELDVDEQLVPCGNIELLPTERRCTTEIAPGTHTFRLRGVVEAGPGDWSSPITHTVGGQPGQPPGRFMVSFHYVPPLTTGEERMAQYTDNFDVDSSADWTELPEGRYDRNASDGVLEQDAWDNDGGLRYNTAHTSIDHETQVTIRANSTGIARWVGPGVRLRPGSSLTGYGIFGHSGVTGFSVVRYINRTRTTVQDVTSGPAVGNSDWITIRIAAQGAVGGNVQISIWWANHGTTKPADPGWIGDDAAPNVTVTDTAVERIDDADALHGGIAGRAQLVAGDVVWDYWRTREISDRGAGGGENSIQEPDAASAQFTGTTPRLNTIIQLPDEL